MKIIVDQVLELQSVIFGTKRSVVLLHISTYLAVRLFAARNNDIDRETPKIRAVS